jgi:hypothetical protein
MKNISCRHAGRGLAVMCLLAAVATPGRAQQTVTRSTLAGEWTGPIALDAGTQNLAFVFRIADTTLAGTVYSDGAKFGDMEGVTLTANRVHFKLDRLDFTGTMEGPVMKVVLIVYNGSTRNLTLKKTPGSGSDSATTPRKPPQR